MDDYKLLPQFLIDALNKKRALNPAESSMAGKYANPANQIGLGDIASSLDPVQTGVRGYNQLSSMNPQDFAKTALLMQSGTLPFLPKTMRDKYVKTGLEGITGAADVFPAAIIGKAGAKAGAKEIAKQIQTGTGLFGKAIIDPRMYAYNPKDANLGSNFERIFMGNNITPKEFNFDDWLGASVVTHPLDRTNRGYIVNEVSGNKIAPEFQFLTEGGIGFGEDANLAKKNIIMASTKNAMLGAFNRALKVQEQNLAQNGSGRILVNPNIQAELGYNFSTMPTELVNAIVKSKGMSPREVEPIDTMIRNTSIGDKKPYKDWVGFADSGALAQLQRGEGINVNPSDLRKIALEKATSVTGQKTIGFNEADLRLALTDPRLTNSQKHDLGLLWYEMDLSRPPEQSLLGSGHKTYNYDAFGTNVGQTAMKPTKDVYGSVYDNIYNTNSSVAKVSGKPLSESTRSQNAIHSLRDLHDNASLFLDKEQINRLKKLFKQ